MFSPKLEVIILKSIKPTDFSYMLSKYLSVHLTGERDLSPNTVLSYRDTFKLLLSYLRDEKRMSPEKIVLDDFNAQLIKEFIGWLKTKRNSSISTCNQRLGTIHAFFEYVQYEMPEKTFLCQNIIGTKMAKKPQPAINYLTLDGIKAILSMPDTTTRNGIRDVAILSLLYDTGARVQELVDLTVADVRFSTPATVRLTGKGRKARIVPLLLGTESILKEYMKNLPDQIYTDNNRPLFCNRDKEKFTRGGITYILKKYAKAAKDVNPWIIPDKLSPHCFRHSKAMHLLQADINLIYIRDLLGHTNVKTTEIYAHADSKAKREALEKASPIKDVVQFPSWRDDSGLMDWLRNFGKQA